MSFGDWAIRITAWLAFGVWFVVVAAVIRTGAGEVGWRVRYLWLAGSVVMLAHVMLSFHFRHEWSHAAAVIETARQTNEMVGFDWGGGVWLNYLFAGVWFCDALWWVLRSGGYMKRQIWANVMVHSFLTFIWFNATVVFGSRPIQVVGAAAFVYLLAGIIQKSLRKRGR